MPDIAIAEHRLHRGKALPVAAAALFALVSIRLWRAIAHLTPDKVGAEVVRHSPDTSKIAKDFSTTFLRHEG